MKMCNYQEQATYGDVLPDMASGYMLFHEALNCLPHVCLSVASCHNVQAYLEHAVYICPPAATIIMWKIVHDHTQSAAQVQLHPTYESCRTYT